MKKRNLALILAAGMMLLAVPAYAEQTETAAVTPEDQISIEGTVIYNVNGLVVTARIAEDGQSLEFEAQNDSDYPMIVSIGNSVVNNITMDYAYGNSGDSIKYSVMDAISYADDSQESFEYLAGYYIEAGSKASFSRSVNVNLKTVFGFDKIDSFSVSLNVCTIAKSLNFDGNDSLTDDEILYAMGSDLMEVVASEASLEETKEPDGELIYEDDSIRIWNLGIDEVYDSYGSVYFAIAAENLSDETLALDTDYHGVALLNEEATDYSSCSLRALPGTMALGNVNLEKEGIASKEDVKSAYCEIVIENDFYEEKGRADMVYGEGVSAEDMRGKSEEKQAEVEAQQEAEAQEAEAQAREEAAALLDYTVEEQTIFDSNGLKVVLTGAGLQQNYGTATDLYLTITNDTDKDVHMGFASVDGEVIGEDSYAYVNGFQVGGTAYVDIPAGETVEDYVTIFDGILKEVGIDNVGEIELGLGFYDEDFEPLADVVPSIIHTSEYDNMDTELSDDMKNIFSESGFEVWAKYVPASEENSAYVLYALKNNTDTPAGIHMDSFKVNGVENEDYMVKFYKFGYELPGRTYLTSSVITPEFMEENNMESVDSLSVRVDFTGSQRGDGTPVVSAGELEIPVE